MKAVIFAGGVGTRLWPMSRKKFPKQFQLLVGEKSIFRQTVDRVLKGFEPEEIFISSGEEYAEHIISQAPEIPKKNLILEPTRRDSLGAVGYATAYVHKYHPNTIIAAVWGADHLVEDEKAFIKNIKLAGKIASLKPVICKVDARPTFPSTYNGWVQIGKPIDKVDGTEIYEFVRFIEKPDLATAKRLFRSFSYLINTGYMAWAATTMLNLYREHQPALFQRLQAIAASIGTPSEQEVLKTEYPKIAKDSVDYGIFEKVKSKDMLVIPADIGWTDIGTWGLLFAGLSEKDTDNITQGPTELVESKGNLIWGSGKKIIATIGAENLVIVDTPDALLVCDRSRTGEVKTLLKRFKDKKKEDLL